MVGRIIVVADMKLDKRKRLRAPYERRLQRMGQSKGTGSESTTLWNKGFIMVLLLGILTQGSSQMVTTLITSYARDNLGAALTFASVLSSTLSISALCCRPFSGVLVDRVNRKDVLLFVDNIFRFIQNWHG